MNVLTYAVDAPGETIQEKVSRLKEYLRICTDIEVDARRQADEARKEIESLSSMDDVSDEEL